MSLSYRINHLVNTKKVQEDILKIWYGRCQYFKASLTVPPILGEISQQNQK
jgi:hypothetical protein